MRRKKLTLRTKSSFPERLSIIATEPVRTLKSCAIHNILRAVEPSEYSGPKKFSTKLGVYITNKIIGK